LYTVKGRNIKQKIQCIKILLMLNDASGARIWPPLHLNQYKPVNSIYTDTILQMLQQMLQFTIQFTDNLLTIFPASEHFTDTCWRRLCFGCIQYENYYSTFCPNIFRHKKYAM
jgi:hypothetical protein